MSDLSIQFPSFSPSTLYNMYQCLSEMRGAHDIHVQLRDVDLSAGSLALIELDEMGLIYKRDLLSRQLPLSYSGMRRRKHQSLLDYSAFLISPFHSGSLFFLTISTAFLLSVMRELWQILPQEQDEQTLIDAVSELGNLLFSRQIVSVREKWGFLKDLRLPVGCLTTDGTLHCDHKHIFTKTVTWNRKIMSLGVLV